MDESFHLGKFTGDRASRQHTHTNFVLFCEIKDKCSTSSTTNIPIHHHTIQFYFTSAKGFERDLKKILLSLLNLSERWDELIPKCLHMFTQNLTPIHAFFMVSMDRGRSGPKDSLETNQPSSSNKTLTRLGWWWWRWWLQWVWCTCVKINMIYVKMYKLNCRSC